MLRGKPNASDLFLRASMLMVRDACSGSFCGYRVAHSHEASHASGTSVEAGPMTRATSLVLR